MADEKKYLNVRISVGEALNKAFKGIMTDKDTIECVFFENEDRNKKSDPHFRSSEGAVWINTYEPKENDLIDDGGEMKID